MVKALVLLASITVECLIFLYYINAVDKRKINKSRMNLIAVVLYSVYGLACGLFDTPTLNIVMFVTMNFAIFAMSLKESKWYSLLRTITLTVFMMFGELVIGLVIDIGRVWEYDQITEQESYILLLFSKLAYFIFVVLFRRISANKEDKISWKEELLFLILPVATCVYLNAFLRVSAQVDEGAHFLLMVVCVLLLVANVLVYIVYNMIVDKNVKISKMREEEHKKEIDRKGYEMLKEKYDDLRSMIHDFEKYCNSIEGLIGVDNDKAKKMLEGVRGRNKEFLLVEYTNNTALNVLINQKLRECAEKGITLDVDIRRKNMMFLDEFDTVTICANVIDNAIEAAENSTEKRVEIKIFDVNEAYAALNVKNSCDEKPVELDGRLVTTKKDKKRHGVGMISIEKIAKKYKGNVRFEYDGKTKVFELSVLLNCR